jgi:hypothetical protein
MKTEIEIHLLVYFWDGGGWGMDWIDIAQDRGRLWAVVNAVMNIQFP